MPGSGKLREHRSACIPSGGGHGERAYHGLVLDLDFAEGSSFRGLCGHLAVCRATWSRVLPLTWPEFSSVPEMRYICHRRTRKYLPALVSLMSSKLWVLSIYPIKPVPTIPLYGSLCK